MEEPFSRRVCNRARVMEASNGPPESSTPRDWFEYLLTLSSEDRQARLAALQDSNAQLAKRVKILLQATGDTDSISPPELNFKDYAGSVLSPGTRIGPYQILEQIGGGGFGLVYKANQREPVRRVVAIKILKLGLDSKEFLARFSAERQALARMEHESIARFLDAGYDPNGRPYLVMEYVPGVPLTQFADEHKLTVKERIELFDRACSAVEHAHQKGVIHRDIKATNILAYLKDSQSIVKVIDFGIAKALSSERLSEMTFNTVQGGTIGTYSAMSPEQAAGSPDIDTRSDVYSLGVLLYELLVGERPFSDTELRKVGQTEAFRIIREVEPPAPSTRIQELAPEVRQRLAAARGMREAELRSRLKTELGWIPLKALRKERSRRYDSVATLRADLSNYLAGRALLAGPESKAYRLQKFYQRNRLPVLLTALLLLIIVCGLMGTSYGLIRAETARKSAELAEMSAREAEAMVSLAEDSQVDSADLWRRALTSTELIRVTIDPDNSTRDFLDALLRTANESQQALPSIRNNRLALVRAFGLVSFLRQLGSAYAATGSLYTAQEVLQQSVSLGETWLRTADDVNNPSWNIELADALMQLFTVEAFLDFSSFDATDTLSDRLTGLTTRAEDLYRQSLNASSPLRQTQAFIGIQTARGANAWFDHDRIYPDVIKPTLGHLYSTYSEDDRTLVLDDFVRGLHEASASDDLDQAYTLVVGFLDPTGRGATSELGFEQSSIPLFLVHLAQWLVDQGDASTARIVLRCGARFARERADLGELAAISLQEMAYRTYLRVDDSRSSRVEAANLLQEAIEIVEMELGQTHPRAFLLRVLLFEVLSSSDLDLQDRAQQIRQDTVELADSAEHLETRFRELIAEGLRER
jgi:serine/threonine protein kinase